MDLVVYCGLYFTGCHCVLLSDNVYSKSRKLVVEHSLLYSCTEIVAGMIQTRAGSLNNQPN